MYIYIPRGRFEKAVFDKFFFAAALNNYELQYQNILKYIYIYIYI